MTKVATEEATRAQVADAIVALFHTLRALHTDATPWLDLDLTMAQLKALMVVVQTSGVSSRGLAERLSTSAPAVTPLVDRLIEQKLVRREDDPGDRRIVLIRPTARALALYEKLMETSRTTVAAVVDDLPESEIPRLEEALAHVLRAAREALARVHKLKTVTAVLLAIMLFPAAHAAAGQSDGVSGAVEPAPVAAAAARPLTAADVITRDAAGTTTVRAIRVTSPIQADGRLDESVYRDVPPFTGFVQSEPSAGAPATEKTEAWVLFDADNVYVVLRCWESRRDRMVLDELRRDSTGIAQNDQVAFAFDTFHDGRNGFVFETTALGGRMDMQITNESANRDWNAIYEARTGWFEGGWVLETRIPFKSLRYSPGPNQVWGFNIRRNNKWKNEITFLSPVPKQYGMGGILRVSTFGTLVGIDAPRSRNLEVKPFVTSSLSTNAAAAPRAANSVASDLGLDVKYGITQNLTADLTYNTDFAQVEVDEQQVNLTRFNLSFPEKREFFLENRGLFSFGTNAGSRPDDTSAETPVLFYSRQIGLHKGRPVAVRAGGRITGKIGRTSVGLIDIQTDEEALAGARATNFSVLRVRRDILRKSSVGAMFTGRSARAAGTGSNEAYGIDGTFGFFHSLNFATYLARTRTDHRAGDEASYRVQMDYNGDRYGVMLENTGIGANFNPEVGFLRRQGVNLTAATLRFSPRPRNSRIVRKFFWSGTGSYIQGPAGRVDARELRGVFQIQFANSDRFEVTSAREYEFVPHPFAISGKATVSVGGYTATNATMGYNFGRQRRMSGNTLVEYGTFYSGHKTAVSLSSGRVRLGTHVSIEPTYSLNSVDLLEGSFTNHLAGSRMTYTMTPQMFTSALVQFNSATHSVSANVRFRWEYRPGSEMFVVFNEQRDTLGRTFPALANRALIVKLNWLARL